MGVTPGELGLRANLVIRAGAIWADLLTESLKVDVSGQSAPEDLFFAVAVRSGQHMLVAL